MDEFSDQEIEPGKGKSLKSKLTLWFLLLALAPMSLVAWISFSNASSNLKGAANLRLQEAADSKSAFIANWFDYRFMDLYSQSRKNGVRVLLERLTEEFKRSGDDIESYRETLRSEVGLRKGVQVDLLNTPRDYDYIYDLFLIDSEGNIVFTALKESDMGQNLFHGSLGETSFATTAKRVMETRDPLFSDIEFYAPSGGGLYGFLVAPVEATGEQAGQLLGVIAMQIELDRVFNFLAFSGQEGSSEKHYIVGDDGRLRSALSSPEDRLNLSIDTKQLRNWLSEHGDHGTELSHMKEPLWEYEGPNGEMVFGKHHDIQLPGVHWALISEIDRAEALKAALWLKILVLWLVAATGAIAMLFAFVQARRLTSPLINLAFASKAAAEGDMDRQVEVVSNDEIGQLGLAFNHMLMIRKDRERALQEAMFMAEEAVYKLKEQQFVLDHHAIVAITDVKGSITFANDKFCEISGYSREELLGKNHRVLKSGLHDRAFFQEMWKIVARGEVWNGEICNRAKDGSLYWMRTTIAPFRGIDGKIESYIAIRSDITEQKKAERALIEAKQSAEKASQAKGEFLANMSHEIRTPMNGVIGMTDLLLDTHLDDEQLHFAENVKGSAESLLGIINDILDFSKVEAGKLELEEVDFELGQLLQELGATIAFRAQEKDLELICPATPMAETHLRADAGRIRQILTNLIGNAIKFTEKGEVAVYCSLLETSEDRTRIKFEVVDTGIGLSEEHQKGLFKRFSQADSTPSRMYGGTGLGLAISRQLTEMMGGEIGVESIQGKGSTFWFTLDLANANGESAKQSRTNLVKQKILVVDDNATTRKLVGSILESWKVEHALADGGAAALEVLEEASAEGRPFSIAIIDMEMPGMDGFQLGGAIKASSKLENTRLLMLADQAKCGDSKQFESKGFAGRVGKPISPSALYNELLRVAGIETLGRETVRRGSKAARPQFDTRVLVVDDNPVNLGVANGLLKKFGIKIGKAANGQEALDILAKIPYDLVFMDCQMPVMDGYEASCLIRDDETDVLNNEIPIIAMTANAMQGARERCLAAGMDDHISKPINLDKLEKILMKYLWDKVTSPAEGVN